MAGKSLARLLREKAEREARKAERERIKKEKEEAKKEAKRQEKRRLVKLKNKRKYHARKRAQREAAHKKIGDERGFYMVLIVKNGKRVRKIGQRGWRSFAIDLFNQSIEENRREVRYPTILLTKNDVKNDSTRNIKVKNEIILIKRMGDEGDTAAPVSRFRDENGKFVDCEIVDLPNYSIIMKDDWYVEETFHVYGYHPIRDRKTYDFIYNELVMSNLRADGDPKRIRTLFNKLIIETSDDFDFVITKNADECQRLYNTILKDAKASKCKQILFTGEVPYPMLESVYDRIQAKTGWRRILCKKKVL